jgi:hypothetical protein
MNISEKIKYESPSRELFEVCIHQKRILMQQSNRLRTTILYTKRDNMK